METDGHPAAVAEEAAQMAEIAASTAPAKSAPRATTPKARQLAAARRNAFSALARVGRRRFSKT